MPGGEGLRALLLSGLVEGVGEFDTQARAADAPGVTQPRVSEIADSRLSQFTTDLITLRHRAGIGGSVDADRLAAEKAAKGFCPDENTTGHAVGAAEIEPATLPPRHEGRCNSDAGAHPPQSTGNRGLVRVGVNSPRRRPCFLSEKRVRSIVHAGGVVKGLSWG